MSVKIEGIIPAMVTPMNHDETINEKALRGQVQRHINAGAYGVFCLGTNGEFYILEKKEKMQIIKTVVDEIAGKIPVYAGTGCIGTKQTVELSQAAQEAGVDVLSIICPHFAVASQAALIDHYKAVAQSVDIPIVLYNIPARTGINLDPATVETLSKIKNIKGIKDSSGNFDNMLQYIERTDSKNFSVLSGNDSLILWNLMAGGKGGITAVANVYPKTMVRIYDKWKIGDYVQARMEQDSIRTLRNCFKFGNPNTVIKTAASLLGQSVGSCRAPFNYLSKEGKAALKKVLNENSKRGMD